MIAIRTLSILGFFAFHAIATDCAAPGSAADKVADQESVHASTLNALTASVNSNPGAFPVNAFSLLASTFNGVSVRQTLQKLQQNANALPDMLSTCDLLAIASAYNGVVRPAVERLSTAVITNEGSFPVGSALFISAAAKELNTAYARFGTTVFDRFTDSQQQIEALVPLDTAERAIEAALDAVVAAFDN